MLREKLQKEIVEAMKAKDSVRVSALKLLSTSLLNAEIAKNREKLTEDEELLVIKREAKKRRDAIEIFKKAGREDRVGVEEAELKVLKDFLPEEISEAEIEKVVHGVIKNLGATGSSDIGRVMGETMKKLSGNADGLKVSGVVRRLLK